MDQYVLPERFYPYFPFGFTCGKFGDGKRISTLTGCDLYIYKHDLEMRAALLCGVLFPDDCQYITRGLNIVRAAERVVKALEEIGMNKEMRAITVETLLETPWSDGAKYFQQFYETIGAPPAVRSDLGIQTGDECDAVSTLIMVEQGARQLDTFLAIYFQVLVGATKLSIDTNYEMPTKNYLLQLDELTKLVQQETRITIHDQNIPKEICGYNEQLHLAGLSTLSDFELVRQELIATTVSSGRLRVS